MDILSVTTINRWSAAQVKASVMDNGWVKIWSHYNEIDQDRQEIILTDREWNRFVSWVEWQRKNNEARTES